MKNTYIPLEKYSIKFLYLIYMYRYSVIRNSKVKPAGIDIAVYILALFGLLTCIWLIVEVALIFTPYTSIFK